MPKPGLLLLILSVYIVGLGIYYLFFNKESRKKWGTPMKFLFYWGLILCSIIVVWEVISLVIK